MKKWIMLFFLVLALFSCASTTIVQEPMDVEISENNLIKVGSQPLFLSGMNLAWMEFAQDLRLFNEDRWKNSVKDLSYAGANTVRWWIHVNGSSSPQWNGDQVSGIAEGELANFKRALDLAWQKGVLVIPCLWSFDMLQPQNGVDQERNRRFLEDDALLQTYIDNALIPMIEYVGHHPAIAAWEIFNEPEGMTSYGWTPVRTEMATIQRVVNRLTGAIHRTDPEALVSNGSWSFKVLTDVGGMTNYYSDDRLIAAGGDTDGTLDFYMVHFYPQHFNDSMSPFHHPASYWELDKPIVIGEFPAFGINDFGKGLAVSSSLTIEETYLYAMENGYAGCLAWTMTNHDGFGGLTDATPGILAVRSVYPDYIKLNQSQMDKIPTVTKEVERQIIQTDTELETPFADLTNYFNDEEDGSNLVFTAESSNPSVVDVQIESSQLSLIPGIETGVTVVTMAAADTFGNTQKQNFLVYQIDPNRGNIALLKPAETSSIDVAANTADKAFDGLTDTRWSSAFEDNQTLSVDLGKVYQIEELKLIWEVAYGKSYQIQGSMDGENWTVLTEVSDGDGATDIIKLTEPALASHIRILGLTRGTEWGFSLWEFEVCGTSQQ